MKQQVILRLRFLRNYGKLANFWGTSHFYVRFSDKIHAWIFKAIWGIGIGIQKFNRDENTHLCQQLSIIEAHRGSTFFGISSR